ncbi:VIT1/CCC1 transporter family protein [Euzebya rosea]|uniref:VIT1/CCC1 transporter family protein n=1 Tax=Euzebya rosea TaxID=2052804 RepID=UPI000D3E7819|nr:VIT1/CCC1 transporter family protein [Euzebya rosea]
MATSEDVARFRENYVEEVNAAWLYRVAADIEEDEAVAGVYLRLAETEERHADLWADRLRDAGEEVPSADPSSRSRVLGWLAKRWGVGVLSNVMASTERAGRTMYDNQPEAAGTSLPADERSHAVILDALRRESAAAPGNGGVRGGVLARLEGRHRAVGGNALRAAVLGANDGLVSNTSLVMGIAGASFAADAVLLTGLAGLLAGAISMALGEWLSVQSSRELNQAQIATERAEILEMPEAEAEELALIYQAKGMSQEEAERAAADIMSDPDAFLDTMVREELGIDPDELGGSAWQAAGTSFALFSLGAIVPVIPFFWLAGGAAVALSLTLAGFALFGLGATTALITGTGIARTGTRSLLLGLIAAGVTYGIGSVLGVTVG